MEKTSEVSAVLFDSDNTLYDYKGPHLAACEAIVDYVGAGDVATLNSYFIFNPPGAGDDTAIGNYFSSIGMYDDQIIISACELYTKRKMQVLTLFDHVLETLVALRSRKISLGVVTNAHPRNVLPLLEKTGIRDFFQCIVTPSDAKARKPASQPFELALSILSARSEHAVMVGDNITNDLIPAKKLGMVTILLISERSSQQLLPRKSPYIDYTITDFSRLPSILDTIP